MPARIRITRGLNAGTVHEIHVNFLRVGSDLSCDLCIPSPDVPSMAFLVEYIEATRSYQVHCKCKDAGYFNGRLMNPGDKRDWAVGQELAVGRSLVLELETDADPSPSPPESRKEKQQQYIEQRIKESDAVAGEATASSGKPGSKKKQASNIMPIIVITACVIISIGSILNGAGAFNSITGPKEQPVPTYREVLAELKKLDDANPQKHLYLRLLMESQRENSPSKEKEAYIQLRNVIFQDRELKDDKKLCEKTIRFINHRIKNAARTDDLGI